jgi:hypothetical protein
MPTDCPKVSHCAFQIRWLNHADALHHPAPAMHPHLFPVPVSVFLPLHLPILRMHHTNYPINRVRVKLFSNFLIMEKDRVSVGLICNGLQINSTLTLRLFFHAKKNCWIIRL